MHVPTRTRVMQQGAKNAPSMFQNAINTLFQDELGIFVCIYIDDIFIFSKTYKEHINHVRYILKKLQDNQFYADRKKSQFLPEELSILGHVITRRGIQLVPGRVRKILDWPTPSNIKEPQTFLSIVNYCSQLAPQLATISSPWTAMAGSTANWDWTHTHQKSFELIEQTLSADLAVRPLDYASPDPIFLVTDASLIGRGAWVGQGLSVSEIRPAAFHFRKFNSAQLNYSTFDKELLAIVDALEHFRPMLSICRFMIFTDYKPLVAFLKQTELLGRQVRWQNTINNFMCNIQYIDGYKNVIADAFSRVFINSEVLPTLSDFIPTKIDSLEPPVSTKINAAVSAPVYSSNSPLHPPAALISIVRLATPTTWSMAKKIEEIPRCRPLLEIQIPKHQETGSPLAVAIRASPAIVVSPLPAPTPAPLSAVQTIEQLAKADPERYETTKMQLPRYDPTNEASRDAAAWHATHTLMYYTACNDPTCVIDRSSYEHRKCFTTWNHC